MYRTSKKIDKIARKYLMGTYMEKFMRNRVVITGMGTVNPCGTNIEEFRQNLQKIPSPTAFRISSYDGEDFEYPEMALPAIDTRVKLESAIKMAGIEGARTKKMTEASKLAQLAVMEAIRDKELSGNGGMIIVGTNNAVNFHDKHRPEDLTKFLVSDIAGDINRNLNIQWPSRTVEATCATGAAAIIDAYTQIVADMHQRVIAVGVDINNPFVSHAMGLARTHQNEHAPCIPLDQNSGGFVAAEGAAAALMIENHERVVNEGRANEILGEIIGIGESNNGRMPNHDKTDPSVTGISSAIRSALCKGHIPAEQIDLIIGHLTGTQKGDRAEIDAISQVFFHEVGITSLKGHTGHTLAAAGIINIIASILAFRGQILSIANLEKPIDMPENIKPWKENAKSIPQNILNLAMGFNGINTAIIVGQAKDLRVA